MPRSSRAGTSSPGKLFHAIVLAGAAFGVQSCGSRSLQQRGGGDAGRPAIDAADVRAADLAEDRASQTDLLIVQNDARDAAVIDAQATEPVADAACDVSCPYSVTTNCQCAIIIL